MRAPDMLALGRSPYKKVYQIHVLPDREDPIHCLLAGGDVQRAVRQCHERLLRGLVTLTAGTAELVLRFVYAPAAEPSNRQSRLSIVLEAGAQDEESARALCLLVECSDLMKYYQLEDIPPFSSDPSRGFAGCQICRVEQAVRPLHPPSENPAIPPMYYTCQPFEPRSDNDYLGLDRILDRVTEAVTVELRVQPVDISTEQSLHTRYLARLQSINRYSRFDDEDSKLHGDPFEPQTYRRAEQPVVIQPLRRQDPIADDIFYSQKRFHESLSHPHLAFQAVVTAGTPAVAQLVGSTVAEAAFEGGSYRLWPFTGRSDAPRPPPPVPTLELVLGPQAAAYAGFRRLAHLATVDELLGLFTLPVASTGAMRCARKNTEPRTVPQERMLIFGFDE